MVSIAPSLRGQRLSRHLQVLISRPTGSGGGMSLPERYFFDLEVEEDIAEHKMLSFTDFGASSGLRAVFRLPGPIRV